MHFLSCQIVTPVRLAADGSGFAFVSQFRVTMRLDPDSDWRFFEYRQFIKGNSSLTRGHFTSIPHTRSNWVADGTPAPGNSFFRIPGGLTENYREDGIVQNGIISRFGYRSNIALNALGIEDRYLPSQRNGRNYHSLDTCGMRGTGREAGVRITYNLFYEGRIIDTRLGAARQTVLTRHWEIRADDIM